MFACARACLREEAQPTWNKKWVITPTERAKTPLTDQINNPDVRVTRVYASHRWKSRLVTAGWWVPVWQTGVGFISGDWLIAWFLLCERRTAPRTRALSVCGGICHSYNSPERRRAYVRRNSESSGTEGRRGKKRETVGGGRGGHWYSVREFPSHLRRTRRSLASAVPLSFTVWSYGDFVTACLTC